MPARRRGSEDPKTRQQPARTLEERENEVISQAIDLAERQIREGTASSQVVTHFLKLGSTREQLEQEKLANDNALTQAKIDQLASQARIEELYGKAIEAMRSYSGAESPSEDDELD